MGASTSISLLIFFSSQGLMEASYAWPWRKKESLPVDSSTFNCSRSSLLVGSAGALRSSNDFRKRS